MNIGSGSETIISLGLGLDDRGGFALTASTLELQEWYPQTKVSKPEMRQANWLYLMTYLLKDTR